MSPACMRTKPPKIERAAEPEPRRARSDSSRGGSSRPAARAAATASAAKPEADEASPDAVGKRLCAVTRARGREAGALAHEVEERRHARGLGGAGGLAVELELVAPSAGSNSTRGLGDERGERQRQAAGGGQVERGVALAPVLDERDVGARARGDAGHLPASDRVAMKPCDARGLPRGEDLGLLASRGASAITAPPPPAPVSLAPCAPACARRRTARRGAAWTRRARRAARGRGSSSRAERRRGRGGAAASVPVSARPPSSLQARVVGAARRSACATRSTIAAVERGAPLRADEHAQRRGSRSAAGRVACGTRRRRRRCASATSTPLGVAVEHAARSRSPRPRSRRRIAPAACAWASSARATATANAADAAEARARRDLRVADERERRAAELERVGDRGERRARTGVVVGGDLEVPRRDVDAQRAARGRRDRVDA